MIEVLSTNIVSPIGGTAYENYKVIKAGLSSVTKHDDQHILPETICASLFKEASLNKYLHPGLTKFESLVYYSISEALQRVRIESGARTIRIHRVDDNLSRAKLNGALRPRHGVQSRELAKTTSRNLIATRTPLAFHRIHAQHHALSPERLGAFRDDARVAHRQ